MCHAPSSRRGGPIMSALLKASRNDAIIARCLQTISQLIPLTSAVFYRVNNRLKPENYILHNISDNTHQQYLENFQPLDPHLPAHFSHQNTTVAAMTPRLCDRNRHYYHEFMLPNNVRDMTEIFIRRERRIIAGISLMRDVPFSMRRASSGPGRCCRWWSWRSATACRKKDDLPAYPDRQRRREIDRHGARRGPVIS